MEEKKQISVIIYITIENRDYIDNVLSKRLFGVEKKRSNVISYLIEKEKRLIENEKNQK